MVVWLRDVPAARATISSSAPQTGGVGVYSVLPYYLTPPRPQACCSATRASPSARFATASGCSPRRSDRADGDERSRGLPGLLLWTGDAGGFILGLNVNPTTIGLRLSA